MPELKDLKLAAQRAMRQAYAPYSQFQVGAALIDDKAQIHAGCNVENSAYPIGCCAEQAAVAAMVLAGGQIIKDMIVVAHRHNPCPPCGACRQVIAEHGNEHTRIHLVDPDGGLISYQLADLLPHAFNPDHLGHE